MIETERPMETSKTQVKEHLHDWLLCPAIANGRPLARDGQPLTVSGVANNLATRLSK